jgi:predicted HTH transcriptional regulator
MTIFNATWPELTLNDVREFLREADDEALLWEAKGTKLDPGEVRRQVCAFADSHEGGYLILGATQAPADHEERWALDGVTFPGGEPPAWIANVIRDTERGVRPAPDFDVQAWQAAAGHVAVVRVTPTSTPPCLANGTVFERVPGQTITVRDPQRLSDLFARGDKAHVDAQARADRAAAELHDAEAHTIAEEVAKAEGNDQLSRGSLCGARSNSQ